jgi:thiol-disulfide isomerase/thioredoxin
MKINKIWILVFAVMLISLAWYIYRQPAFRAGDPLPDTSIQLPSKEVIQLSDLKGKYVLLQFWGSWCGPCRRENPHLVELYSRYHQAGFEIVSIGVEENQKAWESAIARDQMRWKYHSTELKMFDGKLPKLFNIKSIPTTFLINPDGIITGVGLDPGQIDKQLATVLTK